ncbi:unnamed protein product [Sphenostylis stenocarpa]|uniref:Uncharacterized protein n=1 Tax=Sphenostylis stenocarpa TaxID=92480 RepID=A0AA86TBW4_9FABA|nr:unnamed protein product [Sphenostylis stenocarpa]
MFLIHTDTVRLFNRTSRNVPPSLSHCESPLTEGEGTHHLHGHFVFHPSLFEFHALHGPFSDPLSSCHWHPRLRWPPPGLPFQASRFFEAFGGDEYDEGTRWAVLIAGSNGYSNCRHQVTHLNFSTLLCFALKDGHIGPSKNHLFLYLSTNPANDKSTFLEKNSLVQPSKAVDQWDADLMHFWDKIRYRTLEVRSHRIPVNHNVKLIGKLLLGIDTGPEQLCSVRPAG